MPRLAKQFRAAAIAPKQARGEPCFYSDWGSFDGSPVMRDQLVPDVPNVARSQRVRSLAVALGEATSFRSCGRICTALFRRRRLVSGFRYLAHKARVLSHHHALLEKPCIGLGRRKTQLRRHGRPANMVARPGLVTVRYVRQCRPFRLPLSRIELYLAKTITTPTGPIMHTPSRRCAAAAILRTNRCHHNVARTAMRRIKPDESGQVFCRCGCGP